MIGGWVKAVPEFLVTFEAPCACGAIAAWHPDAKAKKVVAKLIKKGVAEL